MCLYKKHIFPKTSKEPIEIYKILKYFDKGTADRRLGQLSCGEGWYTPNKNTKVSFGKPIKAKRSWLWGICPLIIKGEGVHAFTKITKAFLYLNQPNEAIFTGIIPPNTRYWVGTGDEIAASEIIINEEFCI